MVPGFYGKIPLKGDFIQRRLDRSFTGGWDKWLQASLENSRARLGTEWLATYLVSPLWRFAISGGILSDQAILGVMMPSVDSVGRHFPLTLAVEIPPTGDLFQIALDQDSWFEELEELALYGLEADFSMDIFEQRLEQHPFSGEVIPSAALPRGEGRMGWTHTGGTSKALISAGFANHIRGVALSGYSLWWTVGSEKIDPTFLVYDGLPPQGEYAAFISGEWDHG